MPGKESEFFLVVEQKFLQDCAMHSTQSQSWESASAEDDEIEAVIGIEPIVVRTHLPHFEVIRTEVAIAAIVSGWRDYPTSAFLVRLLTDKKPAGAVRETVRRVVRVRVPIAAVGEAQAGGDEVMGTRAAAGYCGFSGPSSLRKAKLEKRIDSVGVDGRRELQWRRSALDRLMGRESLPPVAPSNAVDLGVDGAGPGVGAAVAAAAAVSPAAPEVSPVPAEVVSPPLTRDDAITPTIDLALTDEHEPVSADASGVGRVTAPAAVREGPAEPAAQEAPATVLGFSPRIPVGTSRRWRPLGGLLLRLQPSAGDSIGGPPRPASRQVTPAPSTGGHRQWLYVPRVSIRSLLLLRGHDRTQCGQQGGERYGHSGRLTTPSPTVIECENGWSSGEFATEGVAIRTRAATLRRGGPSV